METASLYLLNTEVCRLCLAEISQNDLDPSHTNAKLISSLIKEINYCLDIFILDNSPFKKVCSSCSIKVQKFARFKLLCSAADKKLKQILRNSLNNKPIQCDEDIKQEDEIPCLIIKSETSNEFFETVTASESKNDTSSIVEELEKDSKNIVISVKAKKQVKLMNVRCQDCFETFSSVTECTKHRLDIHEIENNLYKCCGCKKRFKSKHSRRAHEFAVCNALKDGYFCEKCNRFLAKRSEYEKHKSYHLKNIPVTVPQENACFRCNECQESFGIRARLINHLNAHFNKSFVCETCGRAFTRKDYLIKHADTHTGAKRYQCPYCGHTTNQKASLIVHIRTHTGERPFQCDICPQKCVSSSNLIAHRRRHFGVKQFQCSICGKQYGYKSSLDDHVSTVHGQATQLQCGVCASSFKNKKNLRRHVRTKHAENGAQTSEKKKKAGKIKSYLLNKKGFTSISIDS